MLSNESLELKQLLDFSGKAPFANNDEAQFKMIDLFAGIGGTRLGFTLTNKVDVVFSSEIDYFARQTYQVNFGEIPSGDITKIPTSDIPDHDILVASCPCQSFSKAGKEGEIDDMRATLLFEILRILKIKRPKAFLLEYLKKFKLHNNGKTFKTTLTTLKELNYDVEYMTLKAKDFGVPQNCERIYIVGFDKQQVANYSDFVFPSPTGLKTKVGDILDIEVDSKYTISDKLWKEQQRRKNNQNNKGNGFCYSVFDEKSPYTNPLSVRYFQDTSEILIKQDGKNPRKLTPREAARLQGFPEQYIIPVSDTQAYKQFSNSVAVPVIYAIAKNILKALENNN